MLVVLAAIAIPGDAAFAGDVRVTDAASDVECDRFLPLRECTPSATDRDATVSVPTVFGELVYSCAISFTLDVSTNGWVYVFDIDISDRGDGRCHGVRSCREKWPASIARGPRGRETLDAGLCLSLSPIGDCVGEVPLVLVRKGADRTVLGRWRPVEASSGPICAITGSWPLDPRERIAVAPAPERR